MRLHRILYHDVFSEVHNIYKLEQLCQAFDPITESSSGLPIDLVGMNGGIISIPIRNINIAKITTVVDLKVKL